MDELVMNIEIVDLLSVDLLRDNPDKYYLFGDNLEGWGKKGQAVIRGEPNAIGIPTKVAPKRDVDSYFTDDNFEMNKQFIDDAFAKIPVGSTVVVPKAGLGTGLAQLDKRAPKTFAYLQSQIGTDNDQLNK